MTSSDAAAAINLDESACDASDLVIVEVVADDHITLFNPTSAAIDVANYRWCQRPNYDSLSTAGGDSSAAPGASVSFNWPEGFSLSGDRGELALYNSSSFGDGSSIVDYLCWGEFSGGRMSEAESGGHWLGSCSSAAPSGETTLRRVMESSGKSQISYAWGSTTPAISCM